MSAHELHHDDDIGYHATAKGYFIGFVLSVVLTAIPFWIVMGNVIPNARTAGVVLLVFAAMQIVVHVIYFLHLNVKVEGGWNMLAFIFTIIVVGIMLAGSIWVMYHMNTNMMPVHDAQTMRNMP